MAEPKKKSRPKESKRKKVSSETSKKVDISDWQHRGLLSFQEVMKILGLKSRTTIYNLLTDGSLIAHKPDGKPGKTGISIKVDSVKSYLEDGTMSPDTWNK